MDYILEETAEKSKRENYYTHSNNIAEYYCTISNIGLVAVGLYFHDLTTLTAAFFSIISHAIPLQRLHDLDMIGVGLISIKVCVNYNTILRHGDVLAWGVIALGINALDTHIHRQYRKHFYRKINDHPGIHVMWHGLAAIALYKLNMGILEDMCAM